MQLSNSKCLLLFPAVTVTVLQWRALARHSNTEASLLISINFDPSKDK